MQKFEPNKRYVFSGEIYLTKPGRAIEYKNSPLCRKWVDEADGQEVQVIDELEGRVQGGAFSYHVMVGWCEELPEPVDFVAALTCGKKIRPAGTDLQYLPARSVLHMMTGANNDWGLNRDKYIKGLWEVEN